jgi:uncharacterized protein (DUF1778 family)
MGASALKQARMEFKTTEETKNLLSEAAQLSGVDLTAFVINSAADRARAVLAEMSMLKLNAEEHARFVQVLSNPPQPTQALKQLMELPELPMR